ncbi:MAG TPA: aspartate aminotransferase family protein, partial [Burkholderiales bacterium]|nr:aspartate aminotransferase family protein [Burkholderiales bacterium]
MTAQPRADAVLDLEHFWMPFTDNRRFKRAPKLVASAKDMYYTTTDGRQVLDGLATLWCVNAGHCRPRIVEAIRAQAGVLDFASSFSLGHPLPFRVATRVAELAPAAMSHVFFTNSGSEAVDTALKMALGYHRLRGEATRTRFIGRERGYHGVNLAGISVSGVPSNRKAFAGALLPAVDHLRHTQDLASRAYARGCPESGAELADELEQRLVPLHGAENIAAVIVEPVAGAGGVLVPPKGYLRRLREICTRHGILLIFDEVICGFGRLGKPFAAQYFDVQPDLITFAKGITSGAAPLGGVLVHDALYEVFMHSPGAGIEFFHGYTYSGHPLACAAALGALDTYAEDDLLTRAAGEIGRAFEDGVHALRGLPNVIDCRNLGLIGAVELAPRPGAVGARAVEAFEQCWDKGVFVRPIGDALAFCPPLIAEKKHLDQMFGTVAQV